MNHISPDFDALDIDAIEKPKPDLRPCGGCGETLAVGVGLRVYRVRSFPPEIVFCISCYRQHERTGGFARPRNERKLRDERLCQECMDSNRDSCILITKDTKAGSKDWLNWWGKKLCKICYNRILRSSATRSRKKTALANSPAKHEEGSARGKERK